MVQIAANKVDVDRAALVVVGATSQAEGELVIFLGWNCESGTLVSTQLPMPIYNCSGGSLHCVFAVRPKRGAPTVVPRGPGPFEEQKTASTGQRSCAAFTTLHVLYSCTPPSHLGPSLAMCCRWPRNKLHST